MHVEGANHLLWLFLAMMGVLGSPIIFGVIASMTEKE